MTRWTGLLLGLALWGCSKETTPTNTAPDAGEPIAPAPANDADPPSPEAPTATNPNPTNSKPPSPATPDNPSPIDNPSPTTPDAEPEPIAEPTVPEPGPTAPNPASSAPDAGTTPSTPLCKRGIASNDAPGDEFFPGVSWWNNWAIEGEGHGEGIEFVPMIWGRSTAGDDIPAGSRFLLGFNEPNFFEQADISPPDAAALWPEVERSAASTGATIAAPSMNFCGPAERCHGTNPYDYLRAFFAACDDCQVDYVAVHWYNCDLPSLRDYLEPGGNLEGFEQFGKPIWLTEFSCNGSASVEEQEAFMREAIPYLEDSPLVYRYSWFSAGPIPNAELVNDDGSPTALGRVYIDLPQNCR